MPAETFGHRSRQYGVAAAGFAIARAHSSRELHDDLGQVLTALKLQSASLSKRLDDDTNASTALLQPAATMVELCDQAIAVVRGIVQALLPPLLDEQGLLDAIRQNAG